jgi:hypothetical protein
MAIGTKLNKSQCKLKNSQQSYLGLAEQRWRVNE